LVFRRPIHMDSIDTLSRRLDRLERENRNLRRLGLAGCGIVSCFVLAAWRSARVDPMDTLQVHKLEVLDPRGVPMITLSPTRNNTGGSIVLRDNSGDKRSWWETDAGTARIVFESPTGKADERTIAGLATMPGKAQMSLLGASGSSVLNTVQNDRPSVTIQDSAGRSLFSAPWNR
jgi:hypothetical protein